jgi:hypothetical protein
MVSLPDGQSEARSPNGLYVIRDVYDRTVPIPGPAHSLVLVDTRKGTSSTIHTFGRHVDILWSPATDSVAVNDHEESNYGTALVFFLPWKGRRVTLLDALARFLHAKRQAALLDNDHLYLTARKWVSDRELLCRLEGWGDQNPKGFTRYYIYEIGKGFRGYRAQGTSPEKRPGDIHDR